VISWLKEAKNTAREMPWTTASIALAVVFGLGAHGDFYYEADAPQIKLMANHEAHGVSMLRAAQRADCDEKIPGFTLVVGMKEYSVELTVPVSGMRSMLHDAQTRFASRRNECNRNAA